MTAKCDENRRGDENRSAHPPELSMLTKRRIEAEILGHVYEVLKARDGAASACRCCS